MFAMPNEEPPRRGRPPTGRKEIVQIGLDEPDYKSLEKLAKSQGETLSSMGRRLLLELLQQKGKRK